jgi:hypothetical protein
MIACPTFTKYLHDVGNPGPGLRKAHTCGRFKLINGITALPS